MYNHCINFILCKYFSSLGLNLNPDGSERVIAALRSIDSPGKFEGFGKLFEKFVESWAKINVKK